MDRQCNAVKMLGEQWLGHRWRLAGFGRGSDMDWTTAWRQGARGEQRRGLLWVALA